MRNLGAVVSSPPKGSQPGAVGRVDRWSETVIAFARLYPCGIETVIAFAGEKWAFLVHFACAEVMPVSAVPCWGCAEVLSVSMSLCCRASCATFFALIGLMWVRARKSSPCTLTLARIWRFLACWASFSRKRGWRGRVGRVFSRTSSRGIPPGEFVAPCAWQSGPSADSVNPSMRS